MPISLKPKYTPVTVWLLATVLWTNLGVLPAQGQDSVAPEGLQTTKIERRHLRECVKAINNGTIHVGMTVHALDQLLGTSFTKEIPLKATDQVGSAYLLDKREFAWRLVVFFDGKGNLDGYYLNNLTWKGYSSSAPASMSVGEIRTRFLHCKTPSQRLNCAIDAIDSGIIRKMTPRSTLSALFGKCSQEREVRSDVLVSSFVFGSAKDSWRLISRGNKDLIYEYYLTNFDCEPWGVKHWGLD